jgi:hypothetical protein
VFDFILDHIISPMLFTEADTDIVIWLFGVEVDFLELIVKDPVGSGLTNHSYKTDSLHYVSTHDDGKYRDIVIL